MRGLEGLPLALATASAYLDQVATSFADYLCLYRASWRRLQQTSPEVSTYEDRQLYLTLQLSSDRPAECRRQSSYINRLSLVLKQYLGVQTTGIAVLPRS